METVLKQGWKQYTLGEIAEYINGRAFKPTEWKREGLPIIRIQNLTKSTDTVNYFGGEYEEKHLIKAGDILLAWSASLDVFIWEDKDAVLNQHIFKVIPNEKLVNKKFYYYLIKSILTTIRTETHGTGMTHITKPKLFSIKVCIPNMDLQEKIVSQLDNFFQAYELLKKEKELARKNYDKLPYVFFKKYEDKYNFKVVSVGDVVLDIRYGTSEKANNQGQGYPILRMNNITSLGVLDSSDLKHLDVSINEFKKCKLELGDILINRTNSRELVGKCAVFNLNGDYLFASYLIRLRVNPKLMLPEYMVLYLSVGAGREEIVNRIHGVTNQWNINSTEIKSVPVMLPPLEVQKKMVEDYNVLVKNLIIEQESKKLDENIEILPLAVLSKAFKGEL